MRNTKRETCKTEIQRKRQLHQMRENEMKDSLLYTQCIMRGFPFFMTSSNHSFQVNHDDSCV